MIGKFLAVIGIVIIAVGIFGIARSSQALLGLNLGTTMQLATDAKTREAQLCKTGEKLEEAKGASQYTPGQGYASSVTMYCVNSEGQKRDVTEAFANQMVDQVGGIFGSTFSNLFGSAIYFVLVAVGLVLAIIGLLLGRRSTPAAAVGLSGVNSVVYTTTPTSGSIDLSKIIQQAQAVKTAGAGDLTARLKQLEEAHSAGLISQSEYDRARQQILDRLK